MITFVDRKSGEHVAGPFTPEQAREWMRARLAERRTLSDVIVSRG